MVSAEWRERFFKAEKPEFYSVDRIRLTTASWLGLRKSAEWKSAEWREGFFKAEKPEFYSAAPIRLTSASWLRLWKSDEMGSKYLEVKPGGFEGRKSCDVPSKDRNDVAAHFNCKCRIGAAQR